MFPGHPTLQLIAVDIRMQDAFLAAEHARRVAQAQDSRSSTAGQPGVIRRSLGAMLVSVGQRIQGSCRSEGAESGAPSLGTLRLAR